MIQCPVCEHSQVNGSECEVCGRDLSRVVGRPAPKIAPIATERMADLEATSPAPLGNVPVVPMGELDAGRFAPVTAVPENVPELEATRLAVAAHVPLEPMADLTVDRAPVDPNKTVLTATRNCRFCGQVLNGRVCDHCGRSAGALAVAPQPGTQTKKGAPQSARCTCGAPGRALERCSECGRFIPAPEQ